MDKSIQLGTEKIVTLLVRFSLPAIIGMLVVALNNMADRIFVGQFCGSMAFAGISLTFPLFMITVATGMLIGVGGGGLISIRLGQGRKEEAERILGGCYLLYLCAGIGVALITVPLLPQILTLFGASEETLPYALEYTRTVFPFILFNYMAFGVNNLIRSEGSPGKAMVHMMVGSLVNLLLNTLFMAVLDFGIKGAALALVIANGTAALLNLYHFVKGSSVLKLRFKYLRFDWKLMAPALAIGTAPFCVQLGVCVVNVLTNRALGQYGGDLAISAMGVIFAVAIFIYMTIMGISQGSQPIIGFNFGAKKFDRVLKTLNVSIYSSIAFATVSLVVVFLFTEQVASLFTKNDQQLIKIASGGMVIFLAMLPLVAFQVIAANYFQSVGSPKKSILLNLLRQVVFLIPLLFILPKIWGLTGIWMAAPVSDILATIVTGWMVYKEVKSLKAAQRSHKPAQADPKVA